MIEHRAFTSSLVKVYVYSTYHRRQSCGPDSTNGPREEGAERRDLEPNICNRLTPLIHIRTVNTRVELDSLNGSYCPGEIPAYTIFALLREIDLKALGKLHHLNPASSSPAPLDVDIFPNVIPTVNAKITSQETAAPSTIAGALSIARWRTGSKHCAQEFVLD